MNYSPFIYAFEQENIAVTGGGARRPGGCHALWNWRDRQGGPDGDRTRLLAMAARGVPVAERVFGAGRDRRSSCSYRCKNVLLEGITVVDSPMRTESGAVRERDRARRRFAAMAPTMTAASGPVATC